jgi:gamma-glutamylaminecyclotransferase
VEGNMQMYSVFVYGTLKEGFANFGINAGQRVPGVFQTVQQYPLFIIGQYFLPWLVNQPGSGEHVLGQVFKINEQVLKDMDVLEQIDEAGWYSRGGIQVQQVGAPVLGSLQAFVYFGATERVSHEYMHAGPLTEFTAAHNIGYLNAN